MIISRPRAAVEEKTAVAAYGHAGSGDYVEIEEISDEGDLHFAVDNIAWIEGSLRLSF